MRFSRIMPRSTSAGRFVLSCSALLVVGAACSVGDASLGTGPGRSGGGIVSSSFALVGRWERFVLFTDAGGAVHASETLWDFRSDGTALRTVVTRNLTDGFADAITTVANWRVQGSSLVLDFVSPASGTVQFFFHINRDILTLDGRDFVRARP
ncbi:MAG: hypothetical protein H7Z74_15030 [Anaerolineae bacterium]|nr:hypothetical protein [Gemmatimonadaceae bacterium]